MYCTNKAIQRTVKIYTKTQKKNIVMDPGSSLQGVGSAKYVLVSTHHDYGSLLTWTLVCGGLPTCKCINVYTGYISFLSLLRPNTHHTQCDGDDEGSTIP